MLQLSQSKITAWQTCKRRFQLRHIDGQSWPQAPHSAEVLAVMEQGEIFHMLAAQSYLLGDDFAFDPADLESPVSTWWGQFQNAKPHPKKDQTVRVEATLTAGLSAAIKLIGRLDLLFLGKEALEVFDWKTGKPRQESDLKSDWQTRIYLALLYQSREILGVAELPAEALSITYWYPRDPQKSVKIRYSEAWHQENWAELTALAVEIESQMGSGEAVWPLTNNQTACSHCVFNVICERKPGEGAEPAEDGLEQEPEMLVAELDVHPDL